MPVARENSRSGESLPRRERLCRREDFRRCYKKGRRKYGSHLTLYFVAGRCANARFGMTVSRKVGRAVVRAKLKRRFREIYRRWPRRKDLPPLDMVIHAKPSAASASFEELRQDLALGLLQALEKKGGARRQERH